MPGFCTEKPTFCPRTLRFRSQKPHRAPGNPDSPAERRASALESRASAPERRVSAPGDEFLPPEDEFPYENVEFERRSMEFPRQKHGAGGGNVPFNEVMRRRVACPSGSSGSTPYFAEAPGRVSSAWRLPSTFGVASAAISRLMDSSSRIRWSIGATCSPLARRCAMCRS